MKTIWQRITSNNVRLAVTTLSVALLSQAASPVLAAEAGSITLAEAGKALLPIVIGPNATEETKASAAILAAGLRNITGAQFEISTKQEPSGITIGTALDWPGQVPPMPAGQADNLGRDDYVLKTKAGGLWLVGRAARGERNAVWDFFYRVGFRQFFPGKDWEIWPSISSLRVAFDTYQTPDFKTRRLALGGGRNGEATEAAFEKWQERNRMISGFFVPRGHTWGSIPKAKKAFVEQHPDVFAARTDGKPRAKLDPTAPGALEIAAEYFVETMEKELKKNPDADGVSVEATDGGGWREDSPLGSPSNQMVTVANYVAKIFQTKFPGKKVGMLAYSYHSAPPTIDLEPNVSVAVSIYAIRGGFTPAELLEGWKQRKADVGIAHPTFNIWTYYRDKPGAGNAADIDALVKDITRYHELGARIWSGSTTPAWAPYGLGHFLISRLLWDTKESANLEAILRDFYTRSFGSVAPEMREYYEACLLASGKPLLSEDLIGRMYRKLDAALQKADSPEVKARIMDLVIHARGMELYLAYQNTASAEHQRAYENLAHFAWRTADRDMLSSYAIINHAPNWDKTLAKWTPPTGELAGVNDAELRDLMAKGIAANKLISFTPIPYSSDLVPLPAPGDSKTPVAANEAALTVTGSNSFYTFAEKSAKGFDFTLTGSVLWPNRGPIKLRLFAKENPEDVPVATLDVPANKEPQPVHLDSPFVGMHRLEVLDSAAGTTVSWPDGQRVVYAASPEQSLRMKSSQIYDAWFFVPRGTKLVGGFSQQPKGRIETADGKVVFDFKAKVETETPREFGGDDTGGATASLDGRYFAVPVPAGADGQSWKFVEARGPKLLMTVPGFLARSAAELLVPKEALPAPK